MPVHQATIEQQRVVIEQGLGGSGLSAEDITRVRVRVRGGSGSGLSAEDIANTDAVMLTLSFLMSKSQMSIQPDALVMYPSSRAHTSTLMEGNGDQ